MKKFLIKKPGSLSGGLLLFLVCLMAAEVRAQYWEWTGSTLPAGGGNFIGTLTQDDLEFRVYNQPRMLLDQSANVLTGLNNTISNSSMPYPVSNHAYGSNNVFIGNLNNSLIFGNGNSNTNSNNSVLLGTDNLIEGVHYSLALGNYLQPGAQGAFVIGSGKDGSNRLQNSIANSLVVAFNSANPSLFVGSPVSPATIGNVGIHTTSPVFPLHAATGLGIGAFSSVTTYAGAGSALSINSHGLGNAITFERNDGGSWEAIKARISISGNGGKDGLRFTVTRDGFGTISPGTTDPVYGNDALFLASDGMVGIGTTNPLAAMEIKGDMLIGNAAIGQRWLLHTRCAQNSDALIIAGDDENGDPAFDKAFAIQRSTGKVLIGNTATDITGDYGLFVEKGILAKKVKVAVPGTTSWSDYVFAPGYQLRSIQQVDEYIKANKHLPDVPGAEDVVKNGIGVAEMDATLLRKIEELTLYVIDLKKELEELKSKNNR